MQRPGTPRGLRREVLSAAHLFPQAVHHVLILPVAPRPNAECDNLLRRNGEVSLANETFALARSDAPFPRAVPAAAKLARSPAPAMDQLSFKLQGLGSKARCSRPWDRNVPDPARGCFPPARPPRPAWCSCTSSLLPTSAFPACHRAIEPADAHESTEPGENPSCGIAVQRLPCCSRRGAGCALLFLGASADEVQHKVEVLPADLAAAAEPDRSEAHPIGEVPAHLVLVEELDKILRGVLLRITLHVHVQGDACENGKRRYHQGCQSGAADALACPATSVGQLREAVVEHIGVLLHELLLLQDLRKLVDHPAQLSCQCLVPRVRLDFRKHLGRGINGVRERGPYWTAAAAGDELVRNGPPEDVRLGIKIVGLGSPVGDVGAAIQAIIAHVGNHPLVGRLVDQRGRDVDAAIVDDHKRSGVALDARFREEGAPEMPLQSFGK
eukprot:scaffold1492_cov257-Pinguiococcus_pyrenoidosus.AAC.6